MAKKKKLVLVSPVGIARYPSLERPDTRFNKMGERHTKLLLDPTKDDVKKFTAQVEELVDAAFEQAKEENRKYAKQMVRVSPINLDTDEDGNETGLIVMGFKQQARVISKKDGKEYKFDVELYDSLGNNIDPKKSRIGAGSKIRVAFEPSPYYAAADKKAGISLRLQGVQVIELVEWGGKDAKSLGFGAVEGGYAFDAAANAFSRDEDDEPDTDLDDAEDGEEAGNDDGDF